MLGKRPRRPWGYSQAVRAGDTVYVPGTASLDEEFNALDPGYLPAQMCNIYRRIGETLAQFSLRLRPCM